MALNNDSLHLVYIVDDKYAMLTGISILSLLENTRNTENIVIHIIATDISKEQELYWREIVSNKVKLDIVYRKNDTYKAVGKMGVDKDIYVSPAALLKFDIANIFPDLDKCLYLDSDTIINRDITRIFEIDISDYYVAAVKDMGNVRDENGKCFLNERIGMLDEDYFNSGVMLLNLRLMRKDEISKKLLFYRISGTNYCMDQDAFNMVFDEKKKIIDYGYNFLTDVLNVYDFQEVNEKFCDGKYESIDECLEKQYILHWAGALKPWIYWLPWSGEFFMRYYIASPYGKNPINLKSPVQLLKKEIERLRQEHAMVVDGMIERRDRLMRKMEWRFPTWKVPSGKRVVIYGAGDVGKSFVRQLSEYHYASVVLWVDRDYKERGISVSDPMKVKKCDFDYVVIALANDKSVEQVTTFLLDIEVPREKIVSL